MLKKHLVNIEQQKSILLLDRKITIPSVSYCLRICQVLYSRHINKFQENYDEDDYTTVITMDELQQPTDADHQHESTEKPQTDNYNKCNGHCKSFDAPAESALAADDKKKKISKFLKSMKTVLIGDSKPVPDLPSNHNGNFCTKYIYKMKGGQKRPPYDKPVEALLSFITSFIGIGILTSIDYYLMKSTVSTTVIGSFGATAVLVFSAIKSPLAQPRNLIFGHLIAALIGVTMQLLLGSKFPWLAAALAVSLSIAIMSLTHTVHPPAGATALIAVYSDQKIHDLGFLYAVIPVLVGALILLVVALVTNNLFPSRKYPNYWY